MQTRLRFGLALGIFALVSFGAALADVPPCGRNAPPGSGRNAPPAGRTLCYSMNEEQAPESAVEEAAVPAQEEAL